MSKDDSSNVEGTLHTPDICIIGSGAAGITLAHQLRNSGKTVVLLEGSTLDVRQPTSMENTETPSRLETTRAAPGGDDLCDGHRFCDRVAQTLYEGTVSPEMEAIDRPFLTRSRIRVYGGTTNCWQGWTRTLAAADFDRRDLDPLMVWPITRATLDPYYHRALRYCSLPDFAPARYDEPHYWVDRGDRPLQVLPRLLGSTMDTVAWTVLSGQGPGNPDGAWDFQVVWGPELLQNPNFTLLRNHNVRQIHRRGGVVTHVTGNEIDYSTDGQRGTRGKHFTVAAKQFVVAAGGIETVRLLLLSDLVDPAQTLGKYFMVHPLNPQAITFSGKAPPSGIYNFYSGWPRLREGMYPPNIFAALVPMAAKLREHAIGNIRVIVNFRSTGGGTMNLNWEQAPAENNRLVLSGATDLLGDRRIRLEWKMNPLDQRTMEQGASLAINELHTQGLLTRSDALDLRVRMPGDHHMGGTRMAASENDGYVDADCRVHQFENLFIASSSVFPTGGYANPTLTIIALAIRLADHLAGRPGMEMDVAEQGSEAVV